MAESDSLKVYYKHTAILESLAKIHNAVKKMKTLTEEQAQLMEDKEKLAQNHIDDAAGLLRSYAQLEQYNQILITHSQLVQSLSIIAQVYIIKNNK